MWCYVFYDTRCYYMLIERFIVTLWLKLTVFGPCFSVFIFWGIFCPMSIHDSGHVFSVFRQISCLILIINTSSLFFSCTWTWTCHIYFLRIDTGHLGKKISLTTTDRCFLCIIKIPIYIKNKYYLLGKQNTMEKNRGGSVHLPYFLPPCRPPANTPLATTDHVNVPR